MKTERNEALWPDGVWASIDEAVAEESRRVQVARSFLPVYDPGPEARTVPSERIENAGDVFSIDEAPVTPLSETWVELVLTRQQVAREAELGTARTLARRAAHLLAQAQDAIVFQGVSAFEREALFSKNRVFQRSGPAPAGLLDVSGSADRVIGVPPLGPETFADLLPLDPETPRFGERTFEAVSKAYVRLQESEHHGPYAVVLPPGPYADTQAALPRTQLRPAERIEALLGTKIRATASLPSMSGFVVSLGGDALGLAVGREPEAVFMFEDAEGKYHFRVWERFALRVRDETAVVRLDFTIPYLSPSGGTDQSIEKKTGAHDEPHE